MNPEFNHKPPIPVSFETHKLMNAMKKCSFESVGAPAPKTPSVSTIQAAKPSRRVEGVIEMGRNALLTIFN